MNWDSPFDPPLTAYGLLPVYLARAALAGEISFAEDDERRRIYLKIRSLAVLLSCALPALVFFLGRNTIGERPALLAAVFVAYAPLVLQQAHFYTVDGVFAFCVLTFFAALNRTLAHPTWGRYLFTGMVVGAAAAVRLNGIALGMVLFAGHCVGDGWRWRRLVDPQPWGAVLVALAILFLLQPYLLLAPERLVAGDSTDDFAYSVAVARGAVLRPWSLVDVHTEPYLYYWTRLLPQAVGWPLAALCAVGLLCALWYRRRDEIPMIVWCLVYFALVGGLHTKHVRYLLPLLPFFALFAARLCQALQRRHWLGVAIVLLAVGYTLFYGLAFTRIYLVEDSRIQAGRFIATHAPTGARIGVESGGFSMRRMVSSQYHFPAAMSMGTLFGTRHYLSCGAAADYLRGHVERMQYIAAIDVNRYRQFTAVPRILPVGHAFYRALWAGELGFDRLARFKVYPRALGMELDDDGAEVSFLGYDHPAVQVFARGVGGHRDPWDDWRDRLVADPRCADGLLAKATDHYQAGDWLAASAALERAAVKHPQMRTIQFLQAVVYSRLGAVDEIRRAIGDYAAGYAGEYAYLIPWATAATASALELPDVALASLRQGLQLADRLRADEHGRMAVSYVQIGQRAEALGWSVNAGEIYTLASQLRPSSDIYTQQGMAFFAGDLVDRSSQAYERALDLDANNTVARVNYGWNLYLQGQLVAAERQFRQVLAQEPSGVAAFNLGLVLLAQRRVDAAMAAYGRAIVEYGADETLRMEVAQDLRELVARNGGLGAGILRRYWAEE